MFFTCDPTSLIMSIPEIVHMGKTDLNIDGKISLARFEAFLNNTLNQCQKKTEKILSGLVQSQISIYQSRCEGLATELFTEKRVSMSAYNESSKIFFLHKNLMPDAWRNKLNFNAIEDIEKFRKSSLCFIIIHKPSKLKSAVKSIEPETFQIIDKSKFYSLPFFKH